MKTLLEISVTEKEKINIDLIKSFIKERPESELFVLASGEDEEFCAQLRSRLFGIVEQNHIKVWNWYPEEREDYERFKGWFLSQFSPCLVYEYALDSETNDYVISQRTSLEAETASITYPRMLRREVPFLKRAAKSFADSTLKSNQRKICIDLSDVVNIEFVTGIQRVCYALVANISDIFGADENTEVIPVYSEPGCNCIIRCSEKEGRFHKQEDFSSEVVQLNDGDFLLMPDINIENVVSKVHFLRRLHNRGVKVYTLLHDIIPIRYPDYFNPVHVKVFTEYARAISKFSGIIANSKATLNDYRSWLEESQIKCTNDFKFTYFHLGCDLTKANPTPIREDEDLSILKQLSERYTFLLVSTIEPRKKHEQVLKAFELLWQQGMDINLVFVGKYGWGLDSFISDLYKHPELNRHFYWLKGISDEYLSRIYEASTAVIVASENEGFGLPVIEAAHYGKKVLLRDIPVFREVAGEGAYYFDTFSSEELKEDILKWIDLYEKGKAPDSAAISPISWQTASMTFCRNLGIIE